MEIVERGKPNRTQYWIRLICGGTLGGILLSFFGYNALYLYFMTIPVSEFNHSTTPASMGLDFQDVNFISSDSTPLSGWFLPSKNTCAVIVLHGYGSNRGEMLLHAQMLNKANFGVFLFDLRGHGKSGGKIRAFGWPDVDDVFAAANWLQKKTELASGKIGILGFSVGGQIALRSAAQDIRLKAVMADDPAFLSHKDAPFQESISGKLQYVFVKLFDKCLEWRAGMTTPIGVTEIIGSITCPIFLISSGKGLAKQSVSRLYNLATGSKTLWEIPDASHGTGIALHSQEYQKRMEAFFKKALLSTE